MFENESNNYDGDVIVDDGTGTPAAPGSYFGLGRADGAVVSSGPRWYGGTGNPDTVLTAPAGSIYSSSDGGAGGVGTLFVNDDGATSWVLASAVV